ncbi:MAG: S-adenosyl-L-methionine-dependent methyltransferase [Monoraphidium minutum]|nr:MAG: S-adenosyl-L-methionine-dependent methyltransferase [Monoraphidium minutum]
MCGMACEAGAQQPPPAQPRAGDDNDDDAMQRRWDALTNVERTALGVSYWRAKAADQIRHPTTGAPLYDDPFSAAAAALRAARRGGAPRVDRQVLAAAGGIVAGLGGGGTLQVVILGAGLDARAWRLQWPRPPGGGGGGGGGVVLWEVDTASILALKARALAGFEVLCARREVVCDLTDTEGLASKLAAAGHAASSPTLWLLEGLIGYFAADDALRLLQTIARLSAPGSRAVVTAPPSESDRRQATANGLTLHHTTYEEVDDTLARAVAAGWVGTVVRREELRERYGVERAQQLLALRLA